MKPCYIYGNCLFLVSTTQYCSQHIDKKQNLTHKLPFVFKECETSHKKLITTSVYSSVTYLNHLTKLRLLHQICNNISSFQRLKKFFNLGGQYLVSSPIQVFIHIQITRQFTSWLIKGLANKSRSLNKMLYGVVSKFIACN